MKKNLVENNIILEIRTGSFLYGTNTQESDIDYVGVFIPPINYYFGLDIVNEVDLSFVSKLENGKNDKNAVDRKFYELRKFVKLCMENNPNMIEILFVNQENKVYSNEIGETFLRNRHLFPYKGLYDKFCGYSFAQKKKMLIKSGNMKDLKNGYDLICELQKEEPNCKYVFEIEKELTKSQFFIDNKNQHLNVGDIYIQKNITIKNAIEQIKNRIDKFGNRKELVEEFDFDVKFASHCVRLLLEGKELLETGEIIFPLKDVNLIKEIRQGKYSLAEVNELIESYEDELRLSKEKSSLPSKPQYDKINSLLIGILKEKFVFGEIHV